MAQTIVNLTLPIVTEKIDQLLSTYPQRPYQDLFNSPELRQKLAAYVLSRLPVIYVTMESRQACNLNPSAGCYSHEQHEHIEQLIHQGIDTLMAHRRTLRRGQNPSLTPTTATPSTWFG
jgi:hypothetical protein